MKADEQSAASARNEKTPLRHISIVDDDASIREALKSLMRSAQFSVDTFASAEDFLASEQFRDTSCLILDLSLPGMNGFDLQKRLKAQQLDIPIIFITAQADEISRQRALKGGAIDLLSKPVRRDTLFKAIQSAIEQHPT